MQVWNVLRAARWKCRPQKSPKNRHLGIIVQLCRAISSQLRHISTIGNKFVKQQYLPHMSSQYGELRLTIDWDRFVSLRHPCKVQRVSCLGSVTARTVVVGVSQTLRRWTEGATYIRQGGHHVGHWSAFLVLYTLGLSARSFFSHIKTCWIVYYVLSADCRFKHNHGTKPWV